MNAEGEMTDDELRIVAGGWSVDTLVAMGTAASKPSSETVTFEYGGLQVTYTQQTA